MQAIRGEFEDDIKKDIFAIDYGLKGILIIFSAFQQLFSYLMRENDKVYDPGIYLLLTCQEVVCTVGAALFYFCYLKNDKLNKLTSANISQRKLINNTLLSGLNDLTNSTLNNKKMSWRIQGDRSLPGVRFLFWLSPKTVNGEECIKVNTGRENAMVFAQHFLFAIKDAFENCGLYFVVKKRSVTVFYDESFASLSQTQAKELLINRKKDLKKALKKACEFYRAVNQKNEQLMRITNKTAISSYGWTFLTSHPGAYQEESKSTVVFSFYIRNPAIREKALCLFRQFYGKEKAHVYGAQLNVTGTDLSKLSLETDDITSVVAEIKALQKKESEKNRAIGKQEIEEESSDEEEAEVFMPPAKSSKEKPAKRSWLKTAFTYMTFNSAEKKEKEHLNSGPKWSDEKYNALVGKQPNNLRKIHYAEGGSSPVTYLAFFDEDKLSHRLKNPKLFGRFKSLFFQQEFATHNLNEQGFKFHPNGTMVLKRCSQSGQKEIEGRLVAWTTDPEIQPPQPLYVFNRLGPH